MQTLLVIVAVILIAGLVWAAVRLAATFGKTPAARHDGRMDTGWNPASGGDSDCSGSSDGGAAGCE